MTDDLITWLRAQLDDDERVAREAGASGPEGSELFVIDDDYRHNTVAVPAARVLAEVDAKRRILWRHQGDEDACADDGHPNPCPTLRLLALPYADREGFRDEWAVTE